MRRLTDRYALSKPIGKGGVGEVWEGWQSRLDRPVAIKLLRAELTANAAAVARFKREARTTCLLHHPNVVTVIDVGTADDGRHFVVMELLEGETLADLLERRGRLSVEEALEIAWQVVRGMAAGQDVGLVHRDLKPENIFVLESGHVKVLDFGLATLLDPNPDELRRLEAELDESGAWEPDAPEQEADSDDVLARLTRPGALMGTPRYMAPEQVLGWRLDHRADLYAFGVILFEMIAGTTPFEGPKPRDFMNQHRREVPPRLDVVAADAPDALAEIVDRLLSKEPSNRPDDWAALGRELSGVAEPPRPGGPTVPLEPVALPDQPYRFLSPFSAASSPIYFGRERDLQLFQALWLDPDVPPLAIVSGASGVGKTSFLSARVAPWLDDTGHLLLRVRGTRQPLLHLARQAARHMGETHSRITDVAAPIDTLRQARQRPIVLVLDQLEEVITTGGPEDADALRSGLSALLSTGDRHVRAILSVREDYLGAILRALHPLPVDLLARTLPLRPLEAPDVRAALVGPGQPGLPVQYPPFEFEDGLPDEIVADLLADSAGEVGPRVQLVGARLWQMVQDDPPPIVIRRHHYRDRLGGARGILSRMLDEAIDSLGAADQGVAKELLRALTHLPGSATSRPAPESELVAYASDTARRRAVLYQLEDRWRVVHGYADDRWPGERVYRVAHEALIRRIQDYGEEGSERNRARQVFHQGLSLWLRGGCLDDDLLPEPHFEIVVRHIADLVLRTPEERRFYERSQAKHNEGWMARRQAQRREQLRRQVQLTLVPALLLVLGVVMGQALADFVTLRVWGIRSLIAMDFSRLDLSGLNLRGARLSGVSLKAANLQGSILTDADLSGADLNQAQLLGTHLEGANLRGASLLAAELQFDRLWGTDLREADLRKARLDGPLGGADFTGARYDASTVWGSGAPPSGALGPGGTAAGARLSGIELSNMDLVGLSAAGAHLQEARITESSLYEADLSGAVLTKARLRDVDMGRADLRDADLQGATLEDVRATWVDLRGADLRDADLSGVDLRHGRLDGAKVCGARFDGAVVDGASWVGAVGCLNTRWPGGVAPDGVTAQADGPATPPSASPSEGG